MKVNILAGTMHSRNCEVEVEGKFYHILAEYCYVGTGDAQATYYVIGEEKSDVAILCGCSVAKGIVMDTKFVNDWFWMEVNTHAGEMICKYENLVRQYRKVG